MTEDEIKNSIKSMPKTSQELIYAMLHGYEIGVNAAKVQQPEEPKEFDPELWNDPKYYPHYAKQQKEQTDDNNNKSDQRS